MTYKAQLRLPEKFIQLGKQYQNNRGITQPQPNQVPQAGRTASNINNSNKKSCCGG